MLSHQSSQGSTRVVAPVNVNTEIQAGLPIADTTQQDKGCTWKMDWSLNAQQLKQKSSIEPLLESLRTIPGIAPQVVRIETVLNELFSNAVDHGVLGLNSTIKINADGFKEFYRRRDQALEKLSKGFVHVHLAYFAMTNGGTLLISMQDSGSGFDYQRHFGFASTNQNGVRQTTTEHLLPYGRGLNLAHSLCESLRFFGSGNQVVARVSWKTAH